MKKLSLCATFFFLIFIVSCKKDEINNPPTSKEASNWNAEVPFKWYNLELKLIKETGGYTPPIAARAIGYTGVALYQSVLGGMPSHQSLQGQLNGLSAIPTAQSNIEYNWAISANASLAELMRNLFATTSAANKNTIDSLENDFLMKLSSTDKQEVIQRSISYGKEVANAIFQWSKTDGGHEAYLSPFPSNYVPPAGPGLLGSNSSGLSTCNASRLGECPFNDPSLTFLKLIIHHLYLQPSLLTLPALFIKQHRKCTALLKTSLMNKKSLHSIGQMEPAHSRLPGT